MGIIFPRMPKPKQFYYRPRYYDERKERLENIKARAEAELAAEKDAVHRIGLQKGFLTESRTNSKFNRTDFREEASGRLIRYVIIVVVILGIFYLVAPDVFLAFWKFK